jgi:hypothetical protein
VRIATELNLHRSYSRAIKGSHEHFEGARLWYLLYVCDHHFSIAYGRPPVIQDDTSIVQHERFLQLPGATQADFRLHSQVAIFIILTQIYNAFGPEVEEKLEEIDLSRLRQWNIEIDRWRVRWEPQLGAMHPSQKLLYRPLSFLTFLSSKSSHIILSFQRCKPSLPLRKAPTQFPLTSRFRATVFSEHIRWSP